MASLSEEPRKYACTICARRKVKCDKQLPCSNCRKAQTQCSYEAPQPPKPRKRAADEDLLARIAQYEQLMRENGIDYTQHANVWVPSTLTPKSEKAASVVDELPAAEETELCLWSRLSPELKYPPLLSLRHRDDPYLHPLPPLHTMLFDCEARVHELHPEPKQIYFLWQKFVDAINPLIKIVHVPTLQKRILDAVWDPINISKPLAALMFSIYTISVTAMSPEECMASFNQERGTLLTRYRSGTVRALAEADFLSTRDLEVLQALVLFVFANPESEIASTLTATAIRISQIMGLHKVDSDTKLSFFEKEMRVRIWWQIKGLDFRVRVASTPGMKSEKFDFGDQRIPFNINDADLHPDMLEPQVEYQGPTEMLCVLMKFATTKWLGSSPKAIKVFECMAPGFSKSQVSMKVENEVISELEAVFEEKYLSKLDRCVPFHDLTYVMAKLVHARLRFKLHHPRGRTAFGEGDAYMSKEESDILFNAALSFVELVQVGFKSKFSSQLFTHLSSTYQIDAYIHVISELRRRCSGPRIDQAWKLVDDLYADHPELIDHVENSLFFALGNLTLEAWEARRKMVAESAKTPRCVEMLWSKRRVADGDIGMTIQGATGLEGWEFDVGDGFDWNSWNDFLRF
ncbi:hypothetical protein KAF25_002153 [Fusarium avenaceum]|uniref:Zn(2)-C6 fungal-type domain-containing protein n=1 Tax=Fusarium avenaceum TaxID=40199 RepID=A0A9P7KRU5_9HYPO|nr:hypothetical protein KAF25_002153 [Fusarium avenaceum]